jgi:hypothetical protein
MWNGERVRGGRALLERERAGQRPARVSCVRAARGRAAAVAAVAAAIAAGTSLSPMRALPACERPCARPHLDCVGLVDDLGEEERLELLPLDHARAVRIDLRDQLVRLGVFRVVAQQHERVAQLLDGERARAVAVCGGRERENSGRQIRSRERVSERVDGRVDGPVWRASLAGLAHTRTRSATAHEVLRGRRALFGDAIWPSPRPCPS